MPAVMMVDPKACIDLQYCTGIPGKIACPYSVAHTAPLKTALAQKRSAEHQNEESIASGSKVTLPHSHICRK